MRDRRNITIAAPEPGQAAAPPPRRRPQIVEPSEPPAPAPVATQVARVVTPPAAPTAAAPAASSGAAEQRRVVVPAPTGDRPPPRPPAREAPPSAPRPGPEGTEKRGWRRLVPSRRVVVGVLLVLVLLAGGVLLWAHRKFESIERVDLTAVLAEPDGGTNYLIVGSDTREGVDPNAPNAGAIVGDDTVGGPERSDTILILRIDDQGSSMLSVPRDLFVTLSPSGQRSRINAAFNDGPAPLIQTLGDQLALPVHHYLEIDFVSFSGLVDALGGITIDFPHPAFDTHSGLNVPEAGPQTLDGTQALAYVRSRFYTEVIDGRNVPEGTGDIGRVARQQQFLSAVMQAVGEERNPFTLAEIADELAEGMRIDDDLGFLDALRLLRRMRGLEPQPTALPTSNFRTSAGAAVLRLVQPGADDVLAGFGSTGSRIDAG